MEEKEKKEDKEKNGISEQQSRSEGSVRKRLLTFALPLVFSLFLVWFSGSICGIFLGKAENGIDLLVITSAAASLSDGVLLWFFGIGSAAAVIIARFRGKKEEEGFNNAVCTVLLLILIFGAVITAEGFFLSPMLLRGTVAPEKLTEAIRYLRLCCVSLMGMALLTAGGSILMAAGESLRLFAAMLIFSAVRVLLTYLFVICFGWGSAGAAFSIVLSVWSAAAYMLFCLIRTEENRRSPRAGRIDWKTAGKFCLIGFLILQQNWFIYATYKMISTQLLFGSGTGIPVVQQPGWSICILANSLIVQMLFSLCLAVSVFISRIAGEGNKEYLWKSVKAGTGLCLTAVLFVSVTLYLLWNLLFGGLTQDPEILQFSREMFLWLSPFQIMHAVWMFLLAFSRGNEKCTASMLVSLFSMAALWAVNRYISIYNAALPQFLCVLTGYPLFWFLSMSLTLLCCLRLIRNIRDNRKAEKQEEDGN